MFFSLASALIGASTVVHAIPVNNGNDENPMQVRLAYAGSTGMYVSWNTYGQLSNPTVHWGTEPGRLNNIASSHVSVSYQTSSTYNNHVKIDHLEPDTMYYYLPQHSTNDTQPHSFRTSRVKGDHEPFKAAVVVDLGTMGGYGLTTHVGDGAANPLEKGEKNTIQSLGESMSDWDFLWHAGDIAYADYWLKEEIQGFLPNTTIEQGAQIYEVILNAFYDEMMAVSSSKPYMVGPGNHEANCDNGGATNDKTNVTYTVDICMPGQTNFTGYINHFRMPSSESGGVGNFWYSFDHGMAHFVQLNTETDLGHGFVAPDEPGGAEKEDAGPFGAYRNEQTDWLRKDLASVNRSEVPWVIVAGHRPWYISVENDTSDVCWICKDVFEPILYEFNVDLVLSGHVHAYQRNAPVYENKADPVGLDNPKYPWYITNGAAGHYDGLDTLDRPFPEYVDFAQDTAYGWSQLTFHNATHLTHEFIASGNGSVLDTATLYKDHTKLSRGI